MCKPKIENDTPARTLDEEVRHEMAHMEVCFGTLNITRLDIAFTAVDNDELPMPPALLAEIPADILMDLMPRFEHKIKFDGVTYREAMTDLHAQIDLWLNEEFTTADRESFDLKCDKRGERWEKLKGQLRLRCEAAQAEIIKTQAQMANLACLMEGLKVSQTVCEE